MKIIDADAFRERVGKAIDGDMFFETENIDFLNGVMTVLDMLKTQPEVKVGDPDAP